MMEGQLVGTDIHGFHTLLDLDVGNIMEEAKTRWLRPNEILAILCNYKYFSISVKPVNFPKSGNIILFDRKMLRNFRKDGHNWKKKKDGKTVKEAHEHLKVGNEERIHVYYAHGQDNPTFVRRCYWLLDKSLEHIVLVHYRETQELQGSPGTPVNSNSSSVSDPSAPWFSSEEHDSGAKHAYNTGPGDNFTVQNHEMRLLEINTLEWDELLLTNDSNNLTAPTGEKVSSFDQSNQIAEKGSLHYGVNNFSAEVSSFGNLTESIARSNNTHSSFPDSVHVQTLGVQVNTNMLRGNSITMGTHDSLDIPVNGGLESQDSFGKWMNHIIVDDEVLEPSISSCHESSVSKALDHHKSSIPEQIFSITEVSPAWAFCTEKTKILITGFFHEEYQHLVKYSLSCVCGDVCVPAETVQVGVYRCLVLRHSPGLVHLFMSFDGHKPISQVLNFEYRTPLLSNLVVASEEKHKWEEFRVQLRLAHLLFSTSKSLSILSNKVSPNAHALKEAKKFSLKTSNISNSWADFIKSIDDNKPPSPQAKDSLFELTLKNKLQEWLLERVIEGSKTTECDFQGQAVIHLCAILGYSWAVYFFTLSGLSLDFRDKHGWTALHWAAYCGREKMVGVLLTAGAKPNLVTDPTPENPGGCTAADLASLKGYDGLAAYLSEKALVEQFKDMSIAGNVSGSLDTSATDTVNTENLSEDQPYLKDTLAAYRTTAEAASLIQAAFRERSLKRQTEEVQFSVPEAEARGIVAALKIQHAFRNFESRKRIMAAGRIQHRFRTWKIRKEYLNLRRHTIKIQAVFRGYQVRRQYRKIIWSVGVLEKAILRWRLKRKGFRGLRVDPIEVDPDPKCGSDTEEDFYRASRKQAEERVERSVVRVQALFRSKKAQEEYRRMKITHNEAKLEYEGLLDPDIFMN
ncbi:calmodulin-binding transcription activator 5 isoform X2 [Alnus glutinosa]|uniref:calmodulin-binding transcription activator 5 isoform X2 n=1 Tax=Alnus glutinosa TaxID=3517 RepID=UPI002D7985CC|nr:calmodulin-binding transcription activator 5 isoform X2 [Alnus glutinosa]